MAENCSSSVRRAALTDMDINQSNIMQYMAIDHGHMPLHCMDNIDGEEVYVLKKKKKNKTAARNKKKPTAAAATRPYPSSTLATKKEPPPRGPLDVDNITLPQELRAGEFQVPVFETPQMVRDKITDYLDDTGASKAGFLRAITKCAFSDPDTDTVISPGRLKTFMSKQGCMFGNVSPVFYAAYVFFEKLRLRDKKPKSEDREIMEELWPNGVDILTDYSKEVIKLRGTRVTIDGYGIIAHEDVSGSESEA